MIEAAAVVSALLGHWDDFAIIAALLFFNAVTRLLAGPQGGECAGGAEERACTEADVLRDGKWQTVAAQRLGARRYRPAPSRRIVPADLRAVAGDYAAHRPIGADRRIAAGAQEDRRRGLFGQHRQARRDDGRRHRHRRNTFFGRTAKLVAGAGAVSHAQQAMFEIGNFLIALAVGARADHGAASGLSRHRRLRMIGTWHDALGILQFVLVLLVASIPVAMPAVFSITMALGRFRSVQAKSDRLASSRRSRRWQASTSSAPTRPAR